MSAKTGIEWTHSTWNPWQGCHKVSAGCKFCYMYRDKERYGQDPATVVRSKSATFNAPLSVKRYEPGSLVFTCSWSDFFIEEADMWRPDAWDIMRQRRDLIFQILTKRPENIIERLPKDWGQGWPNVWLGVSVEDQQRAVERIPHLICTPAAVRFLSCEPLLGPVDLRNLDLGRGRHLDALTCDLKTAAGEVYAGPPSGAGPIDWVIAGSESGPKRRSTDPAWVRALRDQCIEAGVPFFLKQLEQDGRLEKLPEIDGQSWAQFPRTP